jgi:pimeloyl-ACP methyl ester carboxylesterase
MRSPTPFAVPDGRRLDTWVVGPADGPALVYHFGTPSSGLPSDAFLEAAAARGLRWVSWSRPGYGDSTRKSGRRVADVVPDTVALLDELRVERAYVAGWSGGGPHALACAALMPERVIATAVLAGVAPYPAPGLDWLADMGTENVEEFNASLEGPEALIGFKERAWPVWRDVSGPDVGAAFGDLVDDVDRERPPTGNGEYLRQHARRPPRQLLGLVRDDMSFVKPWGFNSPGSGARSTSGRAATTGCPVRPRPVLTANVGRAIPHLLPEHANCRRGRLVRRDPRRAFATPA